MFQKVIIMLSIGIGIGLIFGALNFNNDSGTTTQDGSQVVREENGIQYIRIAARGGYSPRQISAKANLPTVLEVETKGTYDCSAALTIPQLRYQKFLPPTGITKVEVPKNLAAGSLDILCSMGMYRAVVNFGSNL